MISHKTARKMAIKFFRKGGRERAVAELEHGACVDDVFKLLVRNQGGKEVERLYFKLPEQLRNYVLMQLVGMVSMSLETALDEVWIKYDKPGTYARPERLKNFQQFIQESEAILLRFLRRV